MINTCFRLFSSPAPPHPHWQSWPLLVKEKNSANLLWLTHQWHLARHGGSLSHVAAKDLFTCTDQTAEGKHIGLQLVKAHHILTNIGFVPGSRLCWQRIKWIFSRTSQQNTEHKTPRIGQILSIDSPPMMACHWAMGETLSISRELSAQICRASNNSRPSWRRVAKSEDSHLNLRNIG